MMNKNTPTRSIALIFRLKSIACIFLISLTGIAVGSSPDAPSELRVNHAGDPLGIDTEKPLFSWVMTDADRNEMQSAYQVIAASSEAFCNAGKGDLWDSGRVLTDGITEVAYAGKPLSSRQRCWWKVRVWDRNANPSIWSKPAHWEMGLLRQRDWKAAWIGGDFERYRTETILPADKKIAQARAYLSASGIFDLSINGQRQGGERVLEPGVSRLNKRMRYCTYDVTESLRRGANAIGVAMGRGRLGHWWLTSREREFILQIEVRFTDGSVMYIVSGKEAWKATQAGPIMPLPPRKSELYQGETYDARNEDGWATAGYDDRAWTALAGEKAVADGGALCAQTAPPMKAGELITPVKVTEPRPGVYVFDMGQKITGWSRLAVTGSRGTKVVLRHGEKLYTPASWADYTITLNAMIVRGATGIRFRISDDENFYMWQLHESGMLICRKKVNGNWTVLKKVQAGLKKDTPYAVVIEAFGQTIKTSIDGKLIDVTEDDTFSSGKIGLWQHDTETAAFYSLFLAPRSGVDLSAGGRKFSLGRDASSDGFADQGFWMNRDHLTISKDQTNPKKPFNLYTLTNNETFQSYDGGIIGQVDQSNLHVFSSAYFADSTDTYILKGEGEEVWEPRFTQHGFRYVEVTGYPGVPSQSSIKGRVVHQSVDGNPGSFYCDNELLNKLHSAFTWTFLNTLQFGAPVDCDQRDERTGWTGDAHCSAIAGNYNYDMINLYDSWLTDLQDTQIESGAIYRTAPVLSLEDVRKYQPMTAWISAYLSIPWDTYMSSGSKTLLEKRYASMKVFVDYLRTDKVKDFIDSKTTYVNWAVPPGGYTNEQLIATAYLYHCVELMSRIAGELGHPEDMAFYAEQSQFIKTAFNAKYLVENKAYKGDTSREVTTQTANALALDFGLCPEEAREAVTQTLVDDIRTKEWHLSTGVLGTKSLLKALGENGQGDVAYALAAQTTFPSWGKWSKDGLTSMCEFWDTHNSHGHAYLGGPLDAYFFSTLAGIVPTKPGYAEFRIKPGVESALKNVSATVNTVKGSVAVKWAKGGDRQFTLDAAVPVNTKAEIYIPTLALEPAKAVITEGGSVIWNHGALVGHPPGLNAALSEKKYIILSVGSGSYRFNMRE